MRVAPRRRQGALAAVEAVGLEYVRDPSNFEVKQDRNYLRQVVLPAVAERQLVGGRAGGKAEELIAEADAKDGLDGE